MVVALALLAGALISLTGLFLLGDEQVRGGGRSSQALATAASILEELALLGFRQSYRICGAAGGNGSSCRVDSRSQPRVAVWLEPFGRSLDDARALIEFDTVDGRRLDDAAAIRVRVTVSWVEGNRRRSVRLITVRT